jgi:hypothetical protein
LRILLLTFNSEPSNPATSRWTHLAWSFKDHGLNLVSLPVQPGRTSDTLVLQQAHSLHDQQAFDLVISSGPPIAAHVTAQGFSRAVGIAWVADWPEPFALESQALTAWFDRHLEANLVRAADQVMVSSEALARKYRSFRGDRDASLLLARDGFEASHFKADHFKPSRPDYNRPDHSRPDHNTRQKIDRERLRIVCSQASNGGTDFNPIPLLETLQTRHALTELLEVIFTRASSNTAAMVRDYGLEHCVHALDAGRSESLALEVSADVLLSFGLKSVYKIPHGLTHLLARQKPILHIFESTSDPSFEVVTGSTHLRSENNRFALTAALEKILDNDWIAANDHARTVLIEEHGWDAIGRGVVGFVCVAGASGGLGSALSGVIRQTATQATAEV